MSTVTAPAARPSSAVRVTFPRVVASEWRKMITLRSTWWTLGVFTALHAGLGALMGANLQYVAQADFPGPLPDATSFATNGLGFSQLALVVLAVLTITAEYSSGQIRNTLMAVPTRVPVLGAKIVVLSVWTFLIGAVACAIALGLGLLTAGEYGQFGLSTGETVWQLLAGPLYLVGIAAFSFAVAALLRNSAAAIALVIALLVLVENIIAILTWTWAQVISPWFPGTAGRQAFMTNADLEATRTNHLALDLSGVVLNQWQGLLVLAGWATLFWLLAAVLLRRRDA